MQRIYELILTGEVDIGLAALPRRDKRFKVYDFENEPLVFVCSPKHPLAEESRIEVYKMQFEKFIGFESGVPTSVLINNILQRYNVVVHPVMQFDNNETIKRAVEINAGVSILPQSTVKQEVASGGLRAIPFSNEDFVRPTGIVVRRDKILGPACRYFIELLCKKGRR